MPALAAKNITTHNNAAKIFGSRNVPPVDKDKLAVAVSANIIIAAKVARLRKPIKKSLRRMATICSQRKPNDFITDLFFQFIISRQQNNFVGLCGVNGGEKFFAPVVVKIGSRFVKEPNIGVDA